MNSGTPATPSSLANPVNTYTHTHMLDDSLAIHKLGALTRHEVITSWHHYSRVQISVPLRHFF